MARALRAARPDEIRIATQPDSSEATSMNHEVIITCAVTGAGDTVGKHPAIPVTPK